ncbi:MULTISPECIES: hypothetical protein [unclassified Bartonella]|uniref:hypothetical protein n=1 Tax=unclassified Bartonella TaxID=2645622 RepID=UPI0035CF1F2C
MCDGADLLLHKPKDGVHYGLICHTIHGLRREMGFGVLNVSLKHTRHYHYLTSDT